jgi:hypothetical protein
MARKEQKTRKEVLTDSRKRAVIAGSAAVATGVATATVGFLPLGVVGLVATGYFGYRWIKHRIDNGIRF